MSRSITKAKLRPRAGTFATALFLGGLALSGVTALLVGPATEPAQAHSEVSSGDQPAPRAVFEGRAIGKPAGRI